MVSKKLDTQTRQDQIAEAALDVVASQGMKALNVAAVAQRVGLVPSAIYRHFKSKEEILDVVLELIGNRLWANVLIVCEQTEHALERLQQLLMRHVKLIRENSAIPSVIFSDEVYGGNRERRLKAGVLIQDYLAEVERIVRNGQRRGQIRPELRAQTVAALFLGIIQPAAIISHLDDTKLNLEKHAGEAWEILRVALETY